MTQPISPSRSHDLFVRLRTTDHQGASAAERASGDERQANLETGLARLPPKLRARLSRFVALTELEAACTTDTEQLLALHAALQWLARAGAVEFTCDEDLPAAVLTPISASFVVELRPLPPVSTLRLSRFACVRREHDSMVLECPLGLARITLASATALDIVFALAVGKPPSTAAAGFLRLLWLARAVYSTEDAAAETMDPTLRQWEFHDLLFHSRSRLGRHDNPMGAQFRFKGELLPQPPVKKMPLGMAAIPLPRPAIARLAFTDPPFAAVLESRCSQRVHGRLPISIEQLGEFLFRVARVRGRTVTEAGELTNRPYPNGGASYELEIYVTVAACAGLAPGFYHYDPLEHVLRLLAAPNQDTDALLFGAYTSSAQQGMPHILLTIASRFQRVAWKYSGMAYATQLKNLGVLYGVMYLAATAMGLAACALGLGDVERFCRLAKTSPFVEASIGEFMLGSQPTGTRQGDP